jgi:hypothetical protein
MTYQFSGAARHDRARSGWVRRSAAMQTPSRGVKHGNNLQHGMVWCVEAGSVDAMYFPVCQICTGPVKDR